MATFRVYVRLGAVILTIWLQYGLTWPENGEREQGDNVTNKFNDLYGPPKLARRFWGVLR